MGLVDESLESLGQASLLHDTACVLYSGGKDSRVCVDLALRSGFKRVIGLFMYFLPDLEVVQPGLDFAEKHWKLKIAQYPHWILFKCLRNGVYCDEPDYLYELPEVSLKHILYWASQDLKVSYFIHGAKKDDSVFRRRTLTSLEKSITNIGLSIGFPIQKWNKFEVMAYLAQFKLDEGLSMIGRGRNAGGVDLDPDAVLYLHDNFPKDFKKIARVFPYVEACVKRREFFGIDFAQAKAKGKTQKGKEAVGSAV